MSKPLSMTPIRILRCLAAGMDRIEQVALSTKASKPLITYHLRNLCAAKLVTKRKVKHMQPEVYTITKRGSNRLVVEIGKLTGEILP